MSRRDPHEVLGVPPGASEREIRLAYRRAAARAHPDAGGATEVFLEIQVAFRILTDPELRRRLDEDPEGVLDTELARERLVARRKRRRARVSKLYE